MRLRSGLLLACLIVVPAIAMFSHKVPAETRGYLRRALMGPLADAAAESLGLGSPAGAAVFTRTPGESPATDDGPAVAAPSTVGGPTSTAASAAAPGPFATPGEPIAAVKPMFPAGAAPGDGRSTGTTAAGEVAGPVSLEVTSLAADRASLESRLRALGATHVEWTPGQGDDGVHRCSCRIPAEPSGQLHRVFQASATDPVTALDTLVGQVTAWSLRTRASGAAPLASPAGEPAATP